MDFLLKACDIGWNHNTSEYERKIHMQRGKRIVLHMKKILLLFIILISIVMLSFSVTFAGTNLNLYYNGKIHALKSTVVNKNDKYYLEADEMAQYWASNLRATFQTKSLPLMTEKQQVRTLQDLWTIP